MTPTQVEAAARALEEFEEAKQFLNKWRGCFIIDAEISGSKACAPGNGKRPGLPHGLANALSATFNAWMVKNVRDKAEACETAGITFGDTI